MAVSDGGNQIIVPAAGTTFPVNVGPPCNFKIVDAWWQDTATAADTLQFTDSKGRLFKFTASSTLQPIAIGKLDWVEGPLTITQMSSGILYIIKGNK